MDINYFPQWWFEYFAKLRIHEMALIMPFLERGQTILEIGAGAGWQSKLLAEQGLNVISIDIEQSNYRMAREWPVLVYDGKHIPLADHSVDVIYSSSVLEHIRHIEAFQKEMQRVLKPSGIAIHVMPNTNWRFWTNLTFYPASCRRIYRKILRKLKQAQPTNSAPTPNSPAQRTSVSNGNLSSLIIGFLWPPRHGEIGNLFTEMYYFNQRRWIKLFRRHGWEIQDVLPNRLFYTGDFILAPYVSLNAREFLSRILGSVCSVYVMRVK